MATTDPVLNRYTNEPIGIGIDDRSEILLSITDAVASAMAVLVSRGSCISEEEALTSRQAPASLLRWRGTGH